MAGGKSKRLQKNIEKPLLQIKKQKLLEIILKKTHKLDNQTIIAISPNTPNTKEYCEQNNYEYIETPGKGYIKDSKFLYNKYGPFISISIDIPFLKTSDIKKLEKNYEGNSLTGVVRKEDLPDEINNQNSFKHQGEEIIPTGLNIYTNKSKNNVIYLDNPKLGLNVNTIEDRKIAEKLWEKHENQKRRTKSQ